jgi:hypothetical protein
VSAAPAAAPARHVDAARERARMRHEGEVGVDAARGLRAERRDSGMHGGAPARCRSTGRCGASGDACPRWACGPAPVLPVTPETNRSASAMPSFSSGTEASSVAVAKQPGCADVRRGRGLQVLGHRAGELLEPLRRAVRVLVDRGIGRGGGEAVVGRDVDDRGLVPLALAAAVEQRSISAALTPCGAAEKMALRGSVADELLDFGLRGIRVAEHAARCGKALPRARRAGCPTSRRRAAEFGWPSTRRSSSPAT